VSEFLAEASVVIRPDTSKFRATLIAELRKATEGIAVPIPVVAQAKGAQSVVRANQQAAASATQASTATKELTASRTKQIITDRELAAQEANLENAERLIAAAQARAAAVADAGIRSTTKLAGARAELRAANVAVTASERAYAASELKGAEATQQAAVESLRAAVALREQAIASEQAAAGTVVNTRATADAIRRNEQLRRGIEANTLELFKIRGATLAASSGFLLGAAAVTIVAKAVEEANKEIEASARVDKVFGEAAAGLEHDARGLAETFGLSTTAALKFEGQIGNILEVAKVAHTNIPQMSEDLVKLAADLAAFADVPVEQTAKAITLGLAGNSRGLRQFGVNLSASAVNAEALALSGKKLTSELTDGDRVLARQTLLFQQTSNAQGAAQRRQEGLAGSSRVLKAEITNLGAAFGTKLIPFLTKTVKSGKDVVSILQQINDKADSLIGTIDKKTGDSGFLHDLKDFAFSSLPADLQKFKQSFLNVKDLFKSSETDLNKLHEAAVKAFRDHDPTIFDRALIKIAGDEHDLSVGFNKLHADQTHAFEVKQVIAFASAIGDVEQAAISLSRAISTRLGGTLAKLQDQMVGIQIAGGDTTQQLANLAKQEQTAKAAVAAAGVTAAATTGAPGHDTAVKALRERRKDLLAIIEQERAIRKQIADDATKAAQDIQKAVEDAQQKVKDAIAAADAATVDTINSLAGNLDIPGLRAAATKSLQDDVALENVRQASIKSRMVLARSIIDVKLRTATLHDLQVQLVQSQIAEKQLNQTIAQNRQQRRAAAFDRAHTSIDLDIELAQTNKNRKAEIAALNARIALDQARDKAVKGDIIAHKKLRNEIAADRARIKELNKELAKRNDALKETQFLFLTARAGFVGNLLSNLIPTNVAAGTVGVGSGGGGGIGVAAIAGLGGPTPRGGTIPGSATRSGGVRDTFGPRQPDLVGVGARTATQTHVAQKGASMSQMSTLIHVQRQMLVVLQRLVSQRTHPEATHQRSQQATATDTV
jgi:hypothetical protein